MKNAFVLVHSIFAIGYIAAAAGHAVGALPFSVLNYPTFFGCYTAAGMLSIAATDYRRHLRIRPRRYRQPDAKPQQAVRPIPGRGAATWRYNTLSA